MDTASCLLLMDTARISAFVSVVNERMKVDNAFKAGYLARLETKLVDILPGTDLRGSPHIESKIKIWKKHYNYVSGMLATSGFRWNDIEKRIDVESDSIWETYVRWASESSAKKKNNKRSRSDDDVIEELSMFADNLVDVMGRINEKLEFIGKMMGYSHDVTSKWASLSDELTKLPITVDERLDVCEIISHDVQKLDMFFSLTHDDRLRWVMRLLSRNVP
ncbi:hypothetical protein ACSBR2_032746 [Camellia fascicularis]